MSFLVLASSINYLQRLINQSSFSIYSKESRLIISYLEFGFITSHSCPSAAESRFISDKVQVQQEAKSISGTVLVLQ